MLNYLDGKSLSFRDLNKIIEKISIEQLKIKSYWKNFVDVYRTREDINDDGWRGEFFGKMMRGSALIYQYSKDKELYQVLEEAVRDMLTTQDELGRFSTYTVEKEFNGWDVWSRKYVITGMLHFYEICKDKKLKKQIVEALRKHIDYIISKVGVDKLSIVETSNWWGGINSASILETIVGFYNIVKEDKYLDFAKYIISTGGTREQNVIDAAYENKLMPYQYVNTKAYETMSFFEGVFEYYKVTKEEKLLTAVMNFVNAVRDTDLTLLGSCGCTHELFDNSSLTQIVEKDLIMQETCVTVTWIRLNTKLLMYTGDIQYFENMESSFYNGMMGSINSNNQKLYTFEVKGLVAPMLFDSYAPLRNSVRGKGTGGFKMFKDGSYFGCCIAIAAAGFALMPLTAVMREDDILVFNNYYTGKVKIKDAFIKINSKYETTGKVVLKFMKDGQYKLKLRVPSWSSESVISYNDIKLAVEPGYVCVDEYFEVGDELTLQFDTSLTAHVIEDAVAFTKGVTLLAFDEEKQDVSYNEVVIDLKKLKTRNAKKNISEKMRFSINGYTFSDYASCGKNYRGKTMGCWVKVK